MTDPTDTVHVWIDVAPEERVLVANQAHYMLTFGDLGDHAPTTREEALGAVLLIEDFIRIRDDLGWADDASQTETKLRVNRTLRDRFARWATEATQGADSGKAHREKAAQGYTGCWVETPPKLSMPLEEHWETWQAMRDEAVRSYDSEIASYQKEARIYAGLVARYDEAVASS